MGLCWSDKTLKLCTGSSAKLNQAIKVTGEALPHCAVGEWVLYQANPHQTCPVAVGQIFWKMGETDQKKNGRRTQIHFNPSSQDSRSVRVQCDIRKLHTHTHKREIAVTFPPELAVEEEPTHSEWKVFFSSGAKPSPNARTKKKIKLNEACCFPFNNALTHTCTHQLTHVEGFCVGLNFLHNWKLFRPLHFGNQSAPPPLAMDAHTLANLKLAASLSINRHTHTYVLGAQTYIPTKEQW